MSKQQYNYLPKGRGFESGNHIYKRKNDKQTIETLFNLIQGGEYDKIKKFISEKNMPFNIQNDQGKTVIHLVLEDDKNNMEEYQKYDLIKFFIDNNAPVSIPDSNNVTPLHLACKFHYKKIVELLLDNGADILAVDNNNMNVLHYLCQGHIVQCKPRKPVKALIPKEGIKKNVPLELKNVFSLIIDILQGDDYKVYMRNIKNTMNNISEILKNELYDKEEEFIGSLSDVISDVGLSVVEKQQKINDKCKEHKDALVKIIQENLKETLKHVEIKPGYTNGWSPDERDSGMLPEDYNMKINSLKNKFSAEKIRLFEEINNIMIELGDLRDNTIYSNNNMGKSVHNVLLHNYNVYLNTYTDIDISVDWNELQKLILYPNIEEFFFQEINVIMDDGSQVPSCIIKKLWCL